MSRSISSHFYPRPPRGGRQLSHHSPSMTANFYPRPPRGGRRTVTPQSRDRWEFLSTPSARRATDAQLSQDAKKKFLSTPSARRATSLLESVWQPFMYFYPRPPRGGRLQDLHLAFQRLQISIHALREEGDSLLRALNLSCWKFLSTPSARRATVKSILSDVFDADFYPRPPRGGRRRKLTGRA